MRFLLIVSPFRLYGEFLNDDISYSDHNHSPNAWATQLGGTWVGRGIVKEAGLEYTHISWGTYTHWAPGLSSHRFWNESRGWPWGNDQDNWCLHARAMPRADIRLSGELNWWIKGDGTLFFYHWDWVHTHNEQPIAGHDDNEGDFQDYAHDPKVLSALIDVEYLPKPWATVHAGYRPALCAGGVRHEASLGVMVWVPEVLTLH